MAKRGKVTTFHGAFSKKSDAKKKEHKVKGGFIQPVKIHGHRRYIVRSQ